MAEKVEKERLDVLLVQRGLAPGRDQAKHILWQAMSMWTA